jgi:hypothetical protein
VGTGRCDLLLSSGGCPVRSQALTDSLDAIFAKEEFLTDLSGLDYSLTPSLRAPGPDIHLTHPEHLPIPCGPACSTLQGPLRNTRPTHPWASTPLAFVISGLQSASSPWPLPVPSASPGPATTLILSHSLKTSWGSSGQQRKSDLPRSKAGLVGESEALKASSNLPHPPGQTGLALTIPC